VPEKQAISVKSAYFSGKVLAVGLALGVQELAYFR